MGVFIRIGDASVLPPIKVDPPSALTASGITGSGAVLSWNRSILGNTYYLQRSTSAEFTDSIQVYSGPARSYVVNNLSIGTTYYFRVRAALSGNFYSDWSNVVSVSPTAGNSLVDSDGAELVDFDGESLIDI